MIWKFDEEYIKNVIKDLSENISSLEKAKTLLERLIGSEVDSREALNILWEVSSLLEDVLAELEPLSDSVSDLAVKIEETEINHSH
jgi:hypothetical protein